MHSLLPIRQKIATWLSLRLVPKSFSIISDDCWGGQIYRQLHIRYLTPTVGLMIRSSDYLNYIENLDSIHHDELIFIKSKKNYPVAKLSNVRIDFMHYASEAEALKKYFDRYARIDRTKIFYKIDFGKKSYTRSDIDRWNRLQLKNSVAFYPPSLEIPRGGIHNGVLVNDWKLDGEAMFDITRKYFDIFAWLRHGRIECGVIYRALNVLFFDPTAQERMAEKLRRVRERRG
jgi:uncharacterized protein (DUF1919 family)